MIHKCSGKGSNAKKTLWRNFSTFIRLRDCIETTGTDGYGKCFTCGEVFPFDLLDCGHGIPGRTNGILFDETICRAQCRKCNRDRCGEVQMFRAKLVELHGESWYEMKLQARKTPTDLPDEVLRAMNKDYLAKIKKLRYEYENG